MDNNNFKYNEEQEVNKLNNKHNNILKALIIILIVILLGLSGYLVYDKVLNKDSNSNSNSNNKSNLDNTTDNKELINDNDNGVVNQEDNSDKVLYIYYQDVLAETSNISWFEFLGKYDCKNDNCYGSNIDSYIDERKKYASITDGEYTFLYDIVNNKNLLQFNETTITIDRFIGKNGLQICNEDYKCAYYDMELNKYLTDFKYNWFKIFPNNVIYASFGDQCSDGGLHWFLCSTGEPSEYNETDLFDLKTGKNLYHDLDLEKKNYVDWIGNNENYYYVISKNGTKELVDSDFKHVMNIEDNNIPYVLQNGELLLNNETYYTKYDSNGNQVYRSKNYQKIVVTHNITSDDDRNIVVVEDGKLKLLTLNEELVVEFNEWNNNLVLLYAIYYDSGEHFNETFDEGIFIEAVESEEDFCFKDATYYYYNLKTKETKIFTHLLECQM